MAYFINTINVTDKIPPFATAKQRPKRIVLNFSTRCCAYSTYVNTISPFPRFRCAERYVFEMRTSNPQNPLNFINIPHKCQSAMETSRSDRESDFFGYFRPLRDNGVVEVSFTRSVSFRPPHVSFITRQARMFSLNIERGIVKL